jgi:hypothetical protein
MNCENCINEIDNALNPALVCDDCGKDGCGSCFSKDGMFAFCKRCQREQEKEAEAG